MASSVEGGHIYRKTKLWGTFPVHQIVSTVGILLLAGFLTFAVSSPSRARWLLTETPYFPVQIGLAFFVGFILQRYLRHRVMQWVWVLPLSVLCVSFGLLHLPVGARIEHYFGTSCRPEFRCFDQLAITLPFYTSVSYSLAAFLSRHFKRRT